MGVNGKSRICEVCGARQSVRGGFYASFPIDEVRCRNWVQLIGNEDLVHVPIEKLHEARHVCGDHFEKRDFGKTGKRLKKRAYPKLHLTAPPLTDQQLSEFPQHVGSKPAEIKEQTIITHTTHNIGQQQAEEPSANDDDFAPPSPVPEVEVEGATTLFSWQKSESIPAVDAEEPVLELQEQTGVSYSVDTPAQTVPQVPEPSVKEVECKGCGKIINGFQFWCVQCVDCALCGACEARGRHKRHYVLRAPTDTPYRQTQVVLAAIRHQLQNGNMLIQPAPDDGVKLEVKEEPPEDVSIVHTATYDDPLDAADPLRHEPQHTSPAEETHRPFKRPRFADYIERFFAAKGRPLPAKVAPLPVKLTSATPRTIKLTSATPRPVELTSATPRTIKLTSATPRTIKLTSATPRTVELTSGTPLPVKPTSAKLRLVELKSATPRTIKLTSATPRTVKPTSATPRPVELTSATPRTMKLTSATPRTVDLTSATPRTIKLTSATSRTVDLTSATFRPIKLTSATHRKIKLTPATLRAVKLTSATPRTIKLTSATPRTVELTSGTPLPGKLTSGAPLQVKVTSTPNKPHEHIINLHHVQDQELETDELRNDEYTDIEMLDDDIDSVDSSIEDDGSIDSRIDEDDADSIDSRDQDDADSIDDAERIDVIDVTRIVNDTDGVEVLADAADSIDSRLEDEDDTDLVTRINETDSVGRTVEEPESILSDLGPRIGVRTEETGKLLARGWPESMVRALSSEAVVEMRPLSSVEIRKWTADSTKRRK